MNKQGENGIGWCTHTLNIAAGCDHDCRWRMPDGTVAECYAKTLAESPTMRDAAYPEGFNNHYWHPQRLLEPKRLKKPARIFIDSMSDLMSNTVPADRVQQVLDMCADAPWHVFQLLTKNAPRLLKFDFPPNVWVGVSAPPTYFMGKELTQQQQERMVMRQLDILNLVKVPVRWMSLEPLSFDVASVMARWWGAQDDRDIPLEWAVIGAASNRREVYQPMPEWVEGVKDMLEGIPLYYKSNLRGNPAAEPWREELPR